MAKTIIDYYVYSRSGSMQEYHTETENVLCPVGMDSMY